MAATTSFLLPQSNFTEPAAMRYCPQRRTRLFYKSYIIIYIITGSDWPTLNFCRLLNALLIKNRFPKQSTACGFDKQDLFPHWRQSDEKHLLSLCF